MSVRTRIYQIVAIIIAIVCLDGCFGPFYSELLTTFKAADKGEYSVIFHDYEIKIVGQTWEKGSKQDPDTFFFYPDIYSTVEYRNRSDMDTIDVVTIDSFYIYFFEGDSKKCIYDAGPKGYEISYYADDKRAHQKLSHGDFNRIVIPKSVDSIRIDFKAMAYNNYTCREVIEEKHFEATLFRYYHKCISLGD